MSQGRHEDQNQFLVWSRTKTGLCYSTESMVSNCTMRSGNRGFVSSFPQKNMLFFRLSADFFSTFHDTKMVISGFWPHFLYFFPVFRDCFSAFPAFRQKYTRSPTNSSSIGSPEAHTCLLGRTTCHKRCVTFYELLYYSQKIKKRIFEDQCMFCLFMTIICKNNSLGT